MKKKYGILCGLLLFFMGFFICSKSAYAAVEDCILTVGNIDADRYAADNPDVVQTMGTDRAMLMFHYFSVGIYERRPVHSMNPEVEAILNSGDKAAIDALYERTLAARATLEEDMAFAYQYYANSVFCGDSVMQGLSLYTSAGKAPILSGTTFLAARSFGVRNALRQNESTQPLYQGVSRALWENIGIIQPQRVFLFFGINDLTYTEPALLMVEYAELIAYIQTYCPGVEINIISMTYPVAGTVKGALTNANVALCNQLLCALCVENGWGFVDVATYTSDGGGSLRPSLTSDNYVHQNKDAYTIWEDVLLQFAIAHKP